MRQMARFIQGQLALAQRVNLAYDEQVGKTSLNEGTKNR
jgi:hypothetical protein